MKDFMIQSISVLPSILMLALLIYFYSQKRIPGLLLLLIAHIVLTLVVIASTFGVAYLSNRFSSATEIQRFYRIIGIISMLMQLVTIVAMGILLHSYPTPNDKQKIADSF